MMKQMTSPHAFFSPRCLAHSLPGWLSREWRFSRGGAVNVPCSSRGQLEQQCEQLPGGEPQQQQPGQPQQQQRLAVGSPRRPALSVDALRQARNHPVQGSGECGLESPGPAPAPIGSNATAGGRIYVVRPDGFGRPRADGPIRLVIEQDARQSDASVSFRRFRQCAA